MTAITGRGWSGVITCHSMPAQVEGNADGVFFYFRNRHKTTWFGLGPTSDDAVVNSIDAPEYEGVNLDLESLTDIERAVRMIDRLLLTRSVGTLARPLEMWVKAGVLT